MPIGEKKRKGCWVCCKYLTSRAGKGPTREARERLSTRFRVLPCLARVLLRNQLGMYLGLQCGSRP